MLSFPLLLLASSLSKLEFEIPLQSLRKAAYSSVGSLAAMQRAIADEKAEKALAFYLGVGPTVQWSCDGTN